MKVAVRVLVCALLLFALSGASSGALGAVYESECEAGMAGLNLWDNSGSDIFAQVVSGNSLMQARADGMELGTRMRYQIQDGDPQSYYNMGFAGFTQQFNVLDPSVDSIITFEYSGTITVSGNNIDYLPFFRTFTPIEVNEYNMLGDYEGLRYENFDIAVTSFDGFHTFTFSDTFEVFYAAGELTLVDTFFLETVIFSAMEVEGGFVFADGGSLTIDNNFYNSLRLVSVEGGIEMATDEVPVPGSILLLFTGLVLLSSQASKPWKTHQ